MFLFFACLIPCSTVSFFDSLESSAALINFHLFRDGRLFVLLIGRFLAWSTTLSSLPTHHGLADTIGLIPR